MCGAERHNPADKEYESVLGILVDTKWLLTHIGRADRNELAAYIREKRAEIHAAELQN